MRAMLRGNDRIERAEWPAALADFAAADSLQTDPRARIFSGTVAAHRARCLFELGDRRRAVSEAHRALAFSPFYVDARLVLAMDAFHGGRLAEAEARLDTLLRVVPGDTIDTRLLEQVRRAEARADSSH
jgi:tetratricopeptide (TPR) repeat protein